MDFDFTKEQRQLGDTVQRFVKNEYGFEARRKILASPEGYSRAVWSQLAEMGLLALRIPEEHGGMGMSSAETLLVMDAIGRGLVLEPYLQSAILATSLLCALGSAGQKASFLPRLAAGQIIAVPAHDEPLARYELRLVATTARRSGEDFILSGRKAVVLHGAAADVLLVSARTAGEVADGQGISLFAVERGAEGISLRSTATFDGQRAAEVTLREVRVPRDALLGVEGAASPALAAAFDVGIAALCAEAVGALQALLDTTIEYTKTRKQFGVPIGKFQALQHRMVDMFIHVEQARSMSYLAALRAADPDPRARARAVSAAKALVGQACRFVGQQAVQLHGGMGMTDELPVSHYFKRLTAIELTLGDTEHHLERFCGSGAAQQDVSRSR